MGYRVSGLGCRIQTLGRVRATGAEGLGDRVKPMTGLEGISAEVLDQIPARAMLGFGFL